MKILRCWKIAAVTGLSTLALAVAVQAQVNTNPVPNPTISWTLDVWGFQGTTGGNGLPVPLSAGLALATNWNDAWQENYTTVNSGGVLVTNLYDITGTGSGANLKYAAFNGAAAIGGSNPAQDANGTYNKQMLNGYLNAGPAAWGPAITNSYVIVSNVPYAKYDVVVYFNSDTSGRHGSIDNGSITNYFSTIGASAINGANALFKAATATDSSSFPSADFAFFPAMTNATLKLTEYPKSGNDQWLGIVGFQIIQSSNVYVLYGASPATQIVPVGQPAVFSVMAGGLNPSYQWRHGGVNIPNATNATYSISATTTGQDGSYDVVISNSFNSVTSSVAALIFYAPKNLQWDGVGSTWDTASANWTINGGVSTVNYTETDNVLFDSLGAGQATVTLSGTLSPSSITVSNATYTLTSGGLTGNGSLLVTSNATLILDTADTRTGPTLIAGGILQLDNGDTAGALGSGALTNNGGLLFNAAGDEAYGYPIYGNGGITNNGSSGLITLANNISASYLVQAGGGSMLLQGSNTITGGVVVQNGKLMARAANCLGTAPVLLSGGELQLIFGIDFTGSSMTLASGLLHGGISGNNSYAGVVSLASDSEIDVSPGGRLTLSNSNGIAGGANYLYVGGGGTLVLAGTNNTCGSAIITAGTLQIGNGGKQGGLGASPITDNGGLAFDLSGDLVVSNSINGSGTLVQNGTNTVYFVGDSSSFSGATTVSTGGLGGTTTFGGAVNVLPGGTLVPGTATAIGTLTINGALTIGGNVLVKVNKSLPQSNDTVVVSSVSNTNNGVVTVNNPGPALHVGDTFQLFSQPVTGGGTLSVSGAGAIWTNNLAVDGTISVLSTTVPRPVITSVVMANSTSLVMGGTNGYPGSTYTVLSSTNVALPLTNWTVETTGNISGSGTFSVTNPVSTGTPQKFYLLRLP